MGSLIVTIQTVTGIKVVGVAEKTLPMSKVRDRLVQTALIMMTMEKRPEIGILKTIGATPGSILKIFMYKGLAIGLIGVVSGWVVALIAIYLQNRFELISLPADIYFISQVTAKMKAIDFIAVSTIAMLISLLATVYPSYKAARLSPVEPLRYEK